MQAQLPATDAGAQASGPSRWITLTGLGLALALAACFGLAQVSGENSSRSVEQAALAEMPPVAAAVAPPMGGEQRHVVYIVATEEQAAYLLRFGAEINSLRTDMGQPLASIGVLIIGTDGVTIEALPGTPGTRFFDVRG